MEDNVANTNNIADNADKKSSMQDSADHYLCHFEKLESSNGVLASCVGELSHQPHDEARVGALIRCLQSQQCVNEQLYDLLVEMNNFFGAYKQ